MTYDIHLVPKSMHLTHLISKLKKSEGPDTSAMTWEDQKERGDFLCNFGEASYWKAQLSVLKIYVVLLKWESATLICVLI